MTCRTSLGLLLLTAGFTFATSAVAQLPSTSPSDPTGKAERAAEGASDEAAEKQSQKAKGDTSSKDGADKKGKTDKSKQTAQLDDDPGAKPKTRGQRNGGPGQTPSQVPDSEEEPAKKAPPRVPWRGTAVSWDHGFTTTIAGIGDDFQSDSHQVYTQAFGLNLNYFVLDEDKYSLAVSTGPGFTTELTNGGTTTRNEPAFRDLNASFVFRARLYTDKEARYATGLIANSTFLLPTSPESQNNGTVLTTSPRVMHWHSIPLLDPDDSPILNSIMIGGSVRWDHRFSNSTTAFNDSGDAVRPRMTANGTDPFNGTFDPSFIGQDTIRESFFVFLSENLGPTNLQLFAGFNFTQSVLGGGAAGGCNFNVTGGCADLPAIEEQTLYSYGFGAGASFFPMPEWGLNFGYSSGGQQLGPDGQRRSIFYNPNAQFSAGVVISIDGIYETVTGPDRNSNFILFSKNEQEKKKTPTKTQNGPTQNGPTRLPSGL